MLQYSKNEQGLSDVSGTSVFGYLNQDSEKKGYSFHSRRLVGYYTTITSVISPYGKPTCEEVLAPVKEIRRDKFETLTSIGLQPMFGNQYFTFDEE